MWASNDTFNMTFSSVQFSRSVMSDPLRPHELQHVRPPCPSPTPRVHSNSRPSSRWWHPAISSSVVPFSSCPQSLPASESFPVSQLFTWGGQSIGDSALVSISPSNTSQRKEDWKFAFTWHWRLGVDVIGEGRNLPLPQVPLRIRHFEGLVTISIR